MPGQITFKLKIEEAGWAQLDLVVKDRVVSMDCSYFFDTLGDLVRAFAQLAKQPGSAEITCLEEPGDVVLKLRRSAEQFHLTVTRFSWEGDGAPRRLIDKARHGGDWGKMLNSRKKKATLRYEGPFSQAVLSFAAAFQDAINEVGAQYVERWGHPFPQEAWDALLANTRQAFEGVDKKP